MHVIFTMSRNLSSSDVDFVGPDKFDLLQFDLLHNQQMLEECNSFVIKKKSGNIFKIF